MEIIIHNDQSPLFSYNSTQSQECPICFSNEPGTLLIEISPCSHKFCKPCLSEYLMTQISELKVLKVKCPEANCPCLLKEQVFHENLDISSFEKYQRLVLKKISYRKQNARFCPKSGCSKPFTPLAGSTHTECSSCNTQICNSCNDFWHQGKNCLDASNPEFQQYARENNLKHCLMCKTIVARVEGCTHITCPICDYEWCWLCGNEFTVQHASKCQRKWNPVPPSSVLKQNNSLSNPAKEMIIRIILFFIMTPLKALFWPFFMLNLPISSFITDVTLTKGLQLLLLLIVNTFYNFIWVSLAFLIQENSDLFLPFGVCIFFVLTLPWAFYGFIKGPQAKKKNQRWLTGDSSAFFYTTAHRPTAIATDNTIRIHL